jgi:hypothetical protein
MSSSQIMCRTNEGGANRATHPSAIFFARRRHERCRKNGDFGTPQVAALSSGYIKFARARKGAMSVHGRSRHFAAAQQLAALSE